MRSLNVLLCGGDGVALRKMARQLIDEGVNVQILNLLQDTVSHSEKLWDFLIIDLDGLNSFMFELLPDLCNRFSKLPIIGISRRSQNDVYRLKVKYGLRLSAYSVDVPRPEELIVNFPEVAAKYMYKTGTLYGKPTTRSLVS